MESLDHRFGMLRPELASTGFAHACAGQACRALLNVLGGLQLTPELPRSVVYPGSGQQGVRTGLISWQFSPHGVAAVLSSAALRDERGAAVAFSTIPAREYFNVVAIRPVSSLTPGAAYTVEMAVRLGTQELQASWAFRTADEAPASSG
jgi:hypothetical protein